MSPRIYKRDEHNISRKNVDPDALKIMSRLNRHGYKAYLVGGGVRDLLLGKAPKDFDVATDATPRRVKAIFPYSRIIGRRFKLVHIYFFNGKVIEVSTFRDSSEAPDPEGEDSELLQRDDNKFGDEETDAIRRDITINALFYDAATASIIDYVGGIEDLKNRRIRVIGDPDVRFAEDPVRLLRVVRHAVRSQSLVDEKCFDSLKQNGALIEKSSQVRVFEELRKDFSSGHFLPFLRLLEKVGLLVYVLPELQGAPIIEGSPFAESLQRIDDMFLNKESLSTALLLSTVALFSDYGSSEKSAWDASDDLSLRWDSLESLELHVQNAFPKLTVPRKERERVLYTLQLWWSLMKDASARKANVTPEYYEFLDEVASLLKILPITIHDKAVFRLIDRLKKDGPGPDEGRRDRRRRGRTRRKRRQTTSEGEV